MAGSSDDARLKRLEERIARMRSVHMAEPTPHQETHHSQAQLAWRMVIELVAGLAIGFGIGMGIDAVFGTAPVFLVLFTLLGFAAGVQTMLRTAAEVGRKRRAGGAGDGAAAQDDTANGTRNG